jgi:hypothetical protein
LLSLLFSLRFRIRLNFRGRGRGMGKIIYICIQMAEINLKTLTTGGGASLIDVNFNGTLEGQADATIPLNVNLTDGVSDVTPTSVALTGNDLDIVIPAPVVPSGVLFQFPSSIQRTSYRTGDSGWLTQNNWFDYTPPTTPKTYAELDYTSANFNFLLKNNLVVNSVSSKTRFVDVDGGQTFSATANKNLLLIDKLTGIGIYRQQITSKAWNTHIDDALALSVTINSVVYNDWYMIPMSVFIKVFGAIYKQQNIIDTATSVNIFPTSFTGSQIDYSFSETSNSTILSYGMSVNILGTLSTRFDSGFTKTDPSQASLYITKQTMSLITAP